MHSAECKVAVCCVLGTQPASVVSATSECCLPPSLLHSFQASPPNGNNEQKSSRKSVEKGQKPPVSH
eukprot:1148256-Pelagomonas_calceolata.AAC.2